MKGERTEFADSIKKCKQYDNMGTKKASKHAEFTFSSKCKPSKLRKIRELLYAYQVIHLIMKQIRISRIWDYQLK